MDMTVKDGVRWSAANAYLRPAMKRPNLDVRTHARATRIIFEGRRAAGVRYLAGDAEHEVRARAGGDPGRRADQFAAAAEAVGRRAGARNCTGHGIGAVLDQPGVGENLQDHTRVLLPGRLQAADHPLLLRRAGRPRLYRARAGSLRKDGLGATNHFESCGFIRSRAGVTATPTFNTTSCRSP